MAQNKMTSAEEWAEQTKKTEGLIKKLANNYVMDAKADDIDAKDILEALANPEKKHLLSDIRIAMDILLYKAQRIENPKERKMRLDYIRSVAEVLVLSKAAKEFVSMQTKENIDAFDELLTKVNNIRFTAIEGSMALESSVTKSVEQKKVYSLEELEKSDRPVYARFFSDFSGKDGKSDGAIGGERVSSHAFGEIQLYALIEKKNDGEMRAMVERISGSKIGEIPTAQDREKFLAALDAKVFGYQQLANQLGLAQGAGLSAIIENKEELFVQNLYEQAKKLSPQQKENIRKSLEGNKTFVDSLVSVLGFGVMFVLGAVGFGFEKTNVTKKIDEVYADSQKMEKTEDGKEISKPLAKWDDAELEKRGISPKMKGLLGWLGKDAPGVALGFSVGLDFDWNNRVNVVALQANVARACVEKILKNPDSIKEIESEIKDPALVESIRQNALFIQGVLNKTDKKDQEDLRKALLSNFSYRVAAELMKQPQNTGWEIQGLFASIGVTTAGIGAMAGINFQSLESKFNDTQKSIDQVTHGQFAEAITKAGGAWPAEKYGITQEHTAASKEDDSEIPEEYTYSSLPAGTTIRFAPEFLDGKNELNGLSFNDATGVISSAVPLSFLKVESIGLDGVKKTMLLVCPYDAKTIDARKKTMMSATAAVAPTTNAASISPDLAMQLDALSSEKRTMIQEFFNKYSTYEIRHNPKIRAIQKDVVTALKQGNMDAIQAILVKNGIIKSTDMIAPVDIARMGSEMIEETAGSWVVRYLLALSRGQEKTVKLEDYQQYALKLSYPKGLKGVNRKNALTMLNKIKDHPVFGWGGDRINKSFDSVLNVSGDVSALQKARETYNKNGNLDNTVYTEKNAIAVVNFSQVVVDKKHGESKAAEGFKSLVPMTGEVRLAGGKPPIKMENPSKELREGVVKGVPDFVLEGFVSQINDNLAKKGQSSRVDAAKIKQMLIDPSYNGGIEGLTLSADLYYARFAKCLNDTYLLKDLKINFIAPSTPGDVPVPSTTGKTEEPDSDIVRIVDSKSVSLSAKTVSFGATLKVLSWGDIFGGDRDTKKSSTSGDDIVTPDGTATPGTR